MNSKAKRSTLRQPPYAARENLPTPKSIVWPSNSRFGIPNQTLLKYDTPDQVPAADKQALTAQFAQNGITVNEANADTGFAAAFNTARGALAFR